MQGTTKFFKGLLGLVTMWPAGFFLIFTLSTASVVLNFGLFVLLFAATVAVSLVLLSVYLSHIMTHLPKEKRSGWILVVILTHPFGMPVYWYSKIWRSAA